jgi:hypothetical protein
MDSEGDCRIRNQIVELALTLMILLRLIVGCFDWNAPIFRIESSSSHCPDFETPKTFVRPPRKPPDKRIPSKQPRPKKILLCDLIRLIVEWNTPFRKTSLLPKANSRAENLSPPSNELLKSPFTRDEDSIALLPSFGIETRVRKRMNEYRVKSKSTFEIPCRESLLETKAEWRLERLSPIETQENKQIRLERKNQTSFKQQDPYQLVPGLFDGGDGSAKDDTATRRPSPPGNEGDNGTVAAERTVRPKSGEPVKKRVIFETSNSSTVGTTLPAEADAPSASKCEHNSCIDISEHDVKLITSAPWLYKTIRNKINEGENSAAVIDEIERRHAQEIDFIPHPSSTHQANTNGRMLTNNEQQNKHNDMKRMP